MGSGAVRTHHSFLAVRVGVSVLEAIHTSGLGLLTKLSLLVVSSEEDFLVDSFLGLLAVGKSYPDGGVGYTSVDCVGADPFYEGRCWGEGLRIHCH